MLYSNCDIRKKNWTKTRRRPIKKVAFHDSLMFKECIIPFLIVYIVFFFFVSFSYKIKRINKIEYIRFISNNLDFRVNLLFDLQERCTLCQNGRSI